MATARAMLERRRSSRVRTRIPVKLLSLHSIPADMRRHQFAECLAVSRTGALLRAPFSPEPGSRIELLHVLSEKRREFRVVQVSAPKEDGQFELGVEMLYPAHDFWGVDFPDEQQD